MGPQTVGDGVVLLGLPPQRPASLAFSRLAVVSARAYPLLSVRRTVTVYVFWGVFSVVACFPRFDQRPPPSAVAHRHARVAYMGLPDHVISRNLTLFIGLRGEGPQVCLKVGQLLSEGRAHLLPASGHVSPLE
jgi:hypothetical protein